ncbi:2-oxo acid dehydrogenase subunit E2 [Cyclobacterium sp.]|uniref:2-oxo acid dehydrogenase subunit E2 n=1 Tax=Cyclobacterium sp. TaxID=1966343 RepID=UPI0019A1A75B|nr:2-oxo acid dehydrogenase subunit E2 [Cyclobacterium sp.]MBD3629291.1 2-oxo acid dehydrogenase subunit E2 [Cyclobacterium sp.]
MENPKIQKFPDYRIASIDICEIGKQKHYVTALIELDVTESKQKIENYHNSRGTKISINAWLISVIACTINKHQTASAFLLGKNKLMIFEKINVSIIVEKDIKGIKVPIPLIIEGANEVSLEGISAQLMEAKNTAFSENDIVLHQKAKQLEKLYFILPGFLRRYFWKFLLKNPPLAYKKMGNVAFTSIGMMGKVNGWFIPISIHPICLGIGSIMKKPSVIDDKIAIREILHVSVLMDHDVIDGAPMARFISHLKDNIENGLNL